MRKTVASLEREVQEKFDAGVRMGREIERKDERAKYEADKRKALLLMTEAAARALEANAQALVACSHLIDNAGLRA